MTGRWLSAFGCVFVLLLATSATSNSRNAAGPCPIPPARFVLAPVDTHASNCLPITKLVLAFNRIS